MEKLKAKPMKISQFLLFWMLAVYLLWPLIIIPTTAAIYFLPPYPPYETINSIYWVGFDNKAIMLTFFTLAMAFVQAWLFRRLLYLKIQNWIPATIIGGLIGTILMWSLRWNPPFEMFTWFLGISLAQYWLIRQRAKNAWLWIFAHLCLSLFFPIYASEWPIVVLKWLVSSTAYGIGTLLVLRELGKESFERENS